MSHSISTDALVALETILIVMPIPDAWIKTGIAVLILVLAVLFGL